MPTNLFITNGASGNLGQRLRELISTSREMRALVGFFYFSGVKVLYEALRENPTIKLRVLVGMEAEEHCGRLQELILTVGEQSRVEAQDAYLENLRRALRSASRLRVWAMPRCVYCHFRAFPRWSCCGAPAMSLKPAPICCWTPPVNCK